MNIYEITFKFCHRYGQCGCLTYFHLQQETTDNEQSVHNELGNRRFPDRFGVDEFFHSLLGLWRVDIWTDCL